MVLATPNQELEQTKSVFAAWKFFFSNFKVEYEKDE